MDSRLMLMLAVGLDEVGFEGLWVWVWEMREGWRDGWRGGGTVEWVDGEVGEIG